MKTLFLKAFTLIGLIGLLQSCYPGGAEYTSDLDIAISQYESVEDLRSYKTYYLVTDSMSVVGIGTDNVLSEAEQQEVINYTNQQLQSVLGLTQVTNPTSENDADLFIQLSQIAVQQQGVVWQPPFWPGYPGWPGWGYPGYPGYPWYGGGYSYYSYSNGTILIDFVDVSKTVEENNPPEEENRYVLILGWEGALNGVLSRANNVSLIKSGIDVLFDQYNTAKAGTDN
ncbi:DUF4136 domain-containing protein [Flammeovirga sp. SJP92]|uniref:DUF4136 domain-containing protein n=1 Tax=Flammeovirga sp. SJP92 TaxID=1775430 RepID=UPI0007874080|nr:DUF4136 domain-containing protein [Flammeovirga sp. SJP92]KXX67977.1 hypothetical protein AVL50_24270 [Flammeovirga sp. SJP92]